MKKRLLRGLIVFLIITLSFSALSVNALAATTLNGVLNGATVTYDGGTVSYNSSTGTITATAATTWVGFGSLGVPLPTTSTITIKNSGSSNAVISFDYNTSQMANGTLTIDDTSYSGTGTYSKEVAPNGSIVVKLTSESKKGASSTITLYRFSLVVVRTINISFVKPSVATVTVNGSTVGESGITVQTTYSTGVNVTASASGYTFYGWLDANNRLISETANTTLHLDDDMTLHPLFVSNSSTGTYWKVGSIIYDDFETALSVANSGADKTAILFRSGSLPTNKSYTVSSGVTVVIPYASNDAGGEFESTAAGTIGSAYRTLTVPSNTSITINSGATWITNAVQSHYNTKYMGNIKGNYGKVVLNGTMTVNGTLKARGIISGNGKMTVNGTAFQFLQLADFRGGNATSDIYTKTFPFNQFYLQNIQVTTDYNYGSNLKAYYYLFAADTGTGGSTLPITLISNESSSLFQLQSGKITFSYSGDSTARSLVTISGTVNTNYLSVTMKMFKIAVEVTYTLRTSDYDCPISGAYQITVASGATMNVAQDFKFLPGSKVTINEGGTVNISSGKQVFLYDTGDYLTTADSGYSHSAYRTKPLTSGGGTVTESEDAQLIVNGTLNVNGSLFVSESGSNGNSITNNSTTGKIVTSSSFSTSEGSVYEATQSSNEGTQLSVKGDPAYALIYSTNAWTKLAASKTYYAYNGKWYSDCTIHYDGNGATSGTTAQQTLTFGSSLSLNSNGFVYPGHTFLGWNTKADGTGTSYNSSIMISVENRVPEITLYAQWQDNTFTVTFNANGHGTAPAALTNVASGSTIIAPTAPTATGYSFDGWYKEAACTNAWNFSTDTVTENKTLYAKWQANTYTLTFKYQTSMNGADSEEKSATIKYTYDGSIQVPSIRYYTLDKWTLTANGNTTTYTGETKETDLSNAIKGLIKNGTNASDITVKAFFERKTYTLNVYRIVGDGSSEPVDLNKTYNVGRSIWISAAEKITRDGIEYTFAYWKINDGAEIAELKTTFFKEDDNVSVVNAVAYYTTEGGSAAAAKTPKLTVRDPFVEKNGDTYIVGMTLEVFAPADESSFNIDYTTDSENTKHFRVGFAYTTDASTTFSERESGNWGADWKSGTYLMRFKVDKDKTFYSYGFLYYNNGSCMYAWVENPSQTSASGYDTHNYDS